MTAIIHGSSARTLISEALFSRLVRRVVADAGVDKTLAERIVDQTLAFLAACAHNPSESLSPSAMVDPGWHAFLLHTRDYADFCERVASRFIHHVPDDDLDTPNHTAEPSHSLTRTLDAITRAGYAVDPALWMGADGKCNQCHEDGHCSSSGADGDENADNRPPGRERG